jgi:hypothetical protein
MSILQQPHLNETVYDYQLVILPPESVRNRLDGIRKKLTAQMLPLGKWELGKNHLPMASFSQFARLEGKLSEHLSLTFSQQAPFRLHLENYGALPHHTIYFRIAESDSFQSLLTLMHQHAYALKVFNQEPRIASLPKINVVYRLGPPDFEQAWHYFRNKQFHQPFIAEGMLLLRRRPWETRWQILKHLAFENQLVTSNQAALFPS